MGSNALIVKCYIVDKRSSLVGFGWVWWVLEGWGVVGGSENNGCIHSSFGKYLVC